MAADIVQILNPGQGLSNTPPRGTVRMWLLIYSTEDGFMGEH